MKPHPICPLPADIRVGDFIHFRDRQRKDVVRLIPGTRMISVIGLSPGWVNQDGQHYGSGGSEWDCIAVERDGEIIAGWNGALKPKKPKKDKDAAWLRKLATYAFVSASDARRLRKIAMRLESSSS